MGYAYDKIGQLTIADSSVPAEDRGYTYDSAWNLNYRTNNGVLGKFIVDNKNELTNALGLTKKYDSNGNPTNSQSGTTIYAYDDENRLVAVTNSGSWAAQFIYDGLGRLRQRQDYTFVSMVGYVSAGQERYVYDGWRVIQERDGSNNPLVSYTRGDDLSGSMEGAGGIGGLLARSSGYSGGNFTTHNYYFADGNGNITYMLNSSQSMVASYRYDPFGNTISSSGTLASANDYHFSGKEIHSNSGMYYYGYRFYDPSLERWINRDPIEEEGGVNLYVFVANDPIERIDTRGLYASYDQKACGCAERSSLRRAWYDLEKVIYSQDYADCLAAKVGKELADKVVKCQKKLDGTSPVTVTCTPRCGRSNVQALGDKSTITICSPQYFGNPPNERSLILAHEMLHLDACGALRHPRTGRQPGKEPIFDAVESCFEQFASK